jgi:hypothetical protein
VGRCVHGLTLLLASDTAVLTRPAAFNPVRSHVDTRRRPHSPRFLNQSTISLPFFQRVSPVSCYAFLRSFTSSDKRCEFDVRISERFSQLFF